MKIRQAISQFFIKNFATKVGSDVFGNQYFLGKNNKRLVIYSGICESTKIPFEWHGWLHYTTNNIPTNYSRYSWQKIHLPNLTGTKNAYSPKHQLSSKSNYDYVAWNPDKINSN